MIEKQTRDNKIEISKLAKETIKLSANIEDVGEALGKVQTAVTTATSGIAALEAATTALTEQTNTVESNISALTQQTTALETQTSSLQIANVGINERLGVVESDLTTQNSNLANQATKIYDHENRISALENGSGGGDTGNTGADNENTGINSNPDNYGTKFYSVQDISSLMHDYRTESFFCTTSIAKFPVCSIGAAIGPQTQVYFRFNPLFTQKPHLKLWFWFSNIPSDFLEFPCIFKLNGKEIVNTILPVLAEDHNAFVEFDIDPTQHNIEMFNILDIHINSTALTYCLLDWLKVEITNAHNPIILNRNTDYEIYGSKKKIEFNRILSSKYFSGGFWRIIGGDDPMLEDDNITATDHGRNNIHGVRFKWATRMPQENFEANAFNYITGTNVDFFITRELKFCACRSSLETTVAEYAENVLYAKKSLHNGQNEDVCYACLTHYDYSVSLLHAHIPVGVKPANLLAPVTFNFNNQDYPKEFVDFIPVYDHTLLSSKNHKISCGYFLHHKSGNIIFVPETQSTYFIKIGKGRQVHAFLSQDNLKIDVFYQIGNNVVQKTLVRETEESEWELTDNLKYYLNVEDVVPFQDFYYTIKNRDILRIEDNLI